MMNEKSSVESVLEKIIEKLQVGCDQEKEIVKRSVKRKLDDILSTNKRRKLTARESFIDLHCRICYDTTQQLPVIYPCKCKGTMAAVHLKCLERWLEESNRNSCELCGHRFVVERTPRYRVVSSIVIWLCLNQHRQQLYVRNLRSDAIRSVVVTPMAIGCCYVCVVAADFYAKNNYDNFPSAQWATYLLLTMMSLLILSYFVWMYMAIQYHQKVWFYWWQKTSTVRIILDPENRTPINYKLNVSQV